MKGIQCVLPAPTKQSTYFAGKPISQSAIARAIDMDQSYLSRILAGKQTPSIRIATLISKALGMSLADFLFHLQSKTGREVGAA